MTESERLESERLEKVIVLVRYMAKRRGARYAEKMLVDAISVEQQERLAAKAKAARPEVRSDYGRFRHRAGYAPVVHSRRTRSASVATFAWHVDPRLPFLVRCRADRERGLGSVPLFRDCLAAKHCSVLSHARTNSFHYLTSTLSIRLHSKPLGTSWKTASAGF
jgi:hypothetical protein